MEKKIPSRYMLYRTIRLCPSNEASIDRNSQMPNNMLGSWNKCVHAKFNIMARVASNAGEHAVHLGLIPRIEFNVSHQIILGIHMCTFSGKTRDCVS